MVKSAIFEMNLEDNSALAVKYQGGLCNFVYLCILK